MSQYAVLGRLFPTGNFRAECKVHPGLTSRVIFSRPFGTFLQMFKGAETLRKQLFATKSIDKLISDSELPEHCLQKTLGPWSLTALGIGAVIGSGIFTVVGTAIAGEKFDTSS